MPNIRDCAETYTRERCYIRELINSPDIPDFSLADCRVEPGVTTELHRLDVREWYVIVAGRGLMELGDAPAYEVGPGDTVSIPRGMPQRISNIGEGDLEFQCICMPRFSAAGYTPLE